MDVDPALLDTDLYELLGVDAGASPEQVTRAYRRLARSLHPDTNADAGAEERFKALAGAYEVLRDPARRRAYDEARRRRGSSPTRRSGGGYTIHVRHLDDAGRPGDAAQGASRPPRFGRQGADRTVTVPITYAEAVLGADITVPTPEGRLVRLRVPPGTASGQVLRIRGHGAATPRGRGDLLVTAQVHVPRQVDERQRELIRRLAELDDPGIRSHLGVS